MLISKNKYWLIITFVLLLAGFSDKWGWFNKKYPFIHVKESKYSHVNPIGINNKLTSGAEYKDINSQVQKFIEKWDLTGAVLCIAHKGKIIYAHGFGMANREEGIVIQPYHLMRIASVSKLITAVAVMRLVEEGKLSLNDKVFGANGILNDKRFLNYKDKRVEEITIHNLLNHSGGWTPRWGDHMFIKEAIAKELKKDLPLDLDDYIVFALSKRLHFQPGSHSSYSNLGFAILQRVIERVSGMDYEEYVQNKIFVPLGINDAHLSNNWDSLRYKNEVRYYEVNQAERVISFDGTKQNIMKSRGGNDVRTLGAAGGWVISPISLTRFVMAIDGQSHFPDLISHHSIATMTDTKDGHFQPLGWRWLKPDGTLWRSGSMAGTTALVVNRPDGYTLVFVANTSPWKGARFPYIVDKFLLRIFEKHIRTLPNIDLTMQGAKE